VQVYGAHTKTRDIDMVMPGHITADILFKKAHDIKSVYHPALRPMSDTQQS